MRFHVRNVLVALLTALVVVAVSAASALAATPEFIREKGTLIGTKFTATSATSAWAITSPKTTWDCMKSTASGEISGTNTISKLVIKYTDCKDGSVAVRSIEDKQLKEGVKGAPEEIVLNPLKGTLGGGPEGKTELTLEPEAGSGKDFTFVKFGTAEAAIRGAVAGTVIPANEFSETSKLVFSAATGLTFAGSPMTLTGTQEITYEPGAKIKVT